MPRKKLQRFQELKVFENVLEFPENIKGRWHAEVFKNSAPIVLELACGAGDYALGLAKMFPEQNFVGVDIQGERIWHGAQRSQTEGLVNVAFLRCYIDHLPQYFGKGEVDEIWVTFPDPHPKLSHAKKRLVSDKFLEIYKEILKPGGTINFKTDSDLLYEFGQEVLADRGIRVIENYSDIYSLEHIDPTLEIKTFYEKKHLKDGKKIKFIKFRL